MANKFEEVRITVRLDKDLYFKLKKYSEKNNSGVSECVRKGIESLLVSDDLKNTTLEEVELQLVKSVVKDTMHEYTERIAKLCVKNGIASAATWFLTTAMYAAQIDGGNSELFLNMLEDCKKKGIDFMRVIHNEEKISNFLSHGTKSLIDRYLNTYSSDED